ncbi:hypothetical protein [Pseudomonas sp.]|uniref:hypothetical protein n=1 Tax=Pseudomonas sp. TaxID=306 RepID=UPI003F313140
MKRIYLLALLVTLVVGAVVIDDPRVAVRNGSGEDILLQGFYWNSSRNAEPLFLRGRNEWRHDCRTCEKGDAFLDGKVDLNTDNPRVFETFNAEFITLRDDYGAQGLRFDFVRGYAPEYVDRWMRTFGDQQFCVGERWKGPSGYPGGLVAGTGGAGSSACRGIDP